MSRKKVAIFLPSLRGGGAERVMLNLAEGFAEKGLKVDLVLAQAEGSYLSQVSPKISIVNLSTARVLLSLPALVRYLRKERPIALLCAMNHANIIALWAKSISRVDTKVIVSEHNSLSVDCQNSSNKKKKLIPFLIHHFYPWADVIIAVSEGVADDLAQTANLPRHRIQVIYNPVITPELIVKTEASIDHPWFVAGEAPVILGVGRLTKQKDFSSLIKAFSIVRQELPVRLIILGEGEERFKLEALVKELCLEGSVSLPGFVSNPYAYMAKASLFVLSSAWEGLPTVLIESMACGTPVVSTDCKSGPAEILENSKYGQLVSVGDVEGLARAIYTTLNNPLESKILQSRGMYFSEEKSITEYLMLLKEPIYQ